MRRAKKMNAKPQTITKYKVFIWLCLKNEFAKNLFRFSFKNVLVGHVHSNPLNFKNRVIDILHPYIDFTLIEVCSSIYYSESIIVNELKLIIM